MRKEDVSVKTIDQLDRNMAIVARVDEPEVEWKARFAACRRTWRSGLAKAWRNWR